MAAISHGLGGCRASSAEAEDRAEQEGQSQEAWEGTTPVPEPPATMGMCPPLGVAQSDCACCVLTVDTWNRRCSGTWTGAFLIESSQHELC